MLNTMHIQSAVFVRGVTHDTNLIRDNIPQIAFIGRSNVGKSSVINSLLGRKALARSSSTPGFTKEANFFLVNEQIYIVDLPGYGYAKGSKADQAKILNLIQWYIFHPEIQQKKIILILDAKVGPSYEDINSIRELEKQGKDIIIVANKIDKLTMSESHKALKHITEVVGPHIQIIPYSAEKKKGVDKLRDVVFG
jgi:GTP-binding protein